MPTSFGNGTSVTSKSLNTAFSTTDADIALKADIASPTFTGTPSAPTATAGTSTTQLATTQFVTTAVGTVTTATRALIGGGSVTITPVANSMTSGNVSWGTTLSASPKVTVSANSFASAVTHTAFTTETTTGVVVWILRTTTTPTRVDAIGIVS